MAVFLAYSRTSVVMASGRELCIVLLLGESHDMKLFLYIIPGILLSYSAPFILLARPSPGSCAVLRWCCILSYRWHLTLLAPRGFEVVPQSQTYCVAGARREFIPTYHICVLMSQVNMLTKVILSPKEITIPESRFLLLWKEGEIPLALQSG